MPLGCFIFKTALCRWVSPKPIPIRAVMSSWLIWKMAFRHVKNHSCSGPIAPACLQLTINSSLTLINTSLHGITSQRTCASGSALLDPSPIRRTGHHIIDRSWYLTPQCIGHLEEGLGVLASTTRWMSEKGGATSDAAFVMNQATTCATIRGPID